MHDDLEIPTFLKVPNTPEERERRRRSWDEYLAKHPPVAAPAFTSSLPRSVTDEDVARFNAEHQLRHKLKAQKRIGRLKSRQEARSAIADGMVWCTRRNKWVEDPVEKRRRELLRGEPVQLKSGATVKYCPKPKRKPKRRRKK